MRVLLIEDRKERQKLFIEKFNINLENYKYILVNGIDKKYQEIYDALKKENYKILKEFEVIISHKSAFEYFNSKIIHRLEKFAKSNNKKLVFFSGGIDTVSYYKEYGFEYMELNSMIFYSKNLKLFLNEFEKNNLNILLLAYGKKWKLNIFIEILDKIAKYMEDVEKDKVLFKTFYREADLGKLENLGFKIKFEKKGITKKEMIEIKNKLAYYIEELIKYENYNS